MLLLKIVFLVTLVAGQRHDVHKMMYRTLTGAAGCFRRMNGTHQFGCSSPRKGSLGVIQLLEEDEQLKFLMDKASAGPYMVVLSPKMMSPEIIDRLKEISGKISGLVFTNRHYGIIEFPESYSPDDTCPNSLESSCDVKNPWNPYGNNYLFTNWNIPIFLVNDEKNYKLIVDCYQNFNLPLDESQSSKPLCSLHMKSHMYAAVSSNVCMRRVNYHFVNPVKYCDPIGNENIIFPMITKKKNIVVSTRIDTATLFDGVSPGAMSSVTGLVTVITTAHIMSNLLPNMKSEPLKKGLIFMLFNGEAFDFIGSNRVLYDMENNNFITKTNRLTLDNIDTFIDVSQMGNVGPMQGKFNDTTYIHAKTKESQLFAKDLIESASAFNLSFLESTNKNLPPTSFTTFYKAAPKMTGLVMTNYENSFKTKFYEGFFDTPETIGYSYYNHSTPDTNSIQFSLARIAATLAKTLAQTMNNYNAADDLTPSTIENYAKTVDELLFCYLKSKKCSLIEAALTIISSENSPDVLPLYVGVPQAVNHMTKASGMMLSYLASPHVNLTKERCNTDETTDDYSLIWMNGENNLGVCVNTTMQFTPAVSPAFAIEDYDWSSGKYPTWTESVWDDNFMEMFLKPSRTDEIIILSFGLITSLSAFLAIYFIKKKSDFIFISQYPTNC